MDNVELPRWLPDIVKEANKKAFIKIRNVTDEHVLCKRWEFIRPAFENISLNLDWLNLSTNYSEEDVNWFVYRIFTIPHDWKEELEKVERWKKYEKNYIKSINKLLKAKADFEKHTLSKDHEVEDALKLIESHLLESLHAISKRNDPNYADYYFSSFIHPSTRKKNINNSHVIYCMRFLSLEARRLFNKPMTNLITNLVNVIFNTDYCYNDVVGHTKDIKNIHERLGDVNFPFASSTMQKLMR